jgi:hypothetical protein
MRLPEKIAATPVRPAADDAFVLNHSQSAIEQRVALGKISWT